MQSQEPIQRPFRTGIYSTIPAADRVVEKLLAAGFRKEQISVVCSNAAVERHFKAFHHQDPAGEHTPAMAAAGGAIGAALGGLTAVGAAIATGGVALVAAGGLALVTGGVVGGLVGAMMTRGVEKELANFYDQEVQKGKILVAVEVEENHPEKLATADRIISEGGAEPLPLREG
jgi:hypothetical protein